MPRQPGVHLLLLERGVCGGGASARVSHRRRRAGDGVRKVEEPGGQGRRVLVACGLIRSAEPSIGLRRRAVELEAVNDDALGARGQGHAHR